MCRNRVGGARGMCCKGRTSLWGVGEGVGFSEGPHGVTGLCQLNDRKYCITCSTPKSPVFRSRGKSDSGSASFSFTLPANQTSLGQLQVQWKWILLKATVLGSTETYAHTHAHH